MRKHKSRKAATQPAVRKPGVGSLILHIITGAFTGGMRIPALACITLAAASYYLQIPHYEKIAALLIGGLAFVGLVRGCANWGKSVTWYRRDIAVQNRREQLNEASRNHAIPGFIPYSDH